MNNSTNISIIIPTLNEEKYIGVLLDSLVAQSDKGFEVIVCDAGSTDKTGKVVQKYTDKLDVKFIQSPQKGVSHQRNYGASKARYDYLMFIDADGYVKPEFLARLKLYIDKHPKTDLVVTWALPLSSKRLYRSLFHMYNLLFMEMLQKLRPVVHLGGFIFVRRPVFNTVGGYDPTKVLGEDHDFIGRVFNNKFKVKVLTRPVMYTSVRRIEKDGWVKYVQVLLKVAYFYLNGGITQDMTETGKINYKMDGGTLYDQDKNKN